MSGRSPSFPRTRTQACATHPTTQTDERIRATNVVVGGSSRSGDSRAEHRPASPTHDPPTVARARAHAHRVLPLAKRRQASACPLPRVPKRLLCCRQALSRSMGWGTGGGQTRSHCGTPPFGGPLGEGVSEDCFGGGGRGGRGGAPLTQRRLMMCHWAGQREHKEKQHNHSHPRPCTTTSNACQSHIRTVGPACSPSETNDGPARHTA